MRKRNILYMYITKRKLGIYMLYVYIAITTLQIGLLQTEKRESYP